MSEPTKTYYGVINEDEFTFHTPRVIDGDETTSLRRAFEDALEMLEEGAEKVSVGPVKYYGEDGNGYWGEDMDYPRITIDAYNADWVREDEEEEDDD